MFNFKNMLFYGLIIGLLFLISCKEDEIIEDNQSQQLEIFPLKIGNSWTYKLNVYPKDDSVDTYRETSIKVVKNTTLNEKNYYNLEFDGNLESNLYINKGDGHYFLSSRISSLPKFCSVKAFPSVFLEPLEIHVSFVGKIE